MDAMKSPSVARVKVDRQGRMVLPIGLREEVVTVPGEVLVWRTADGLLLTAAEMPGTVREADDGFPVLSLGRRVTNEEVLRAIDQERADRRWTRRRSWPPSSRTTSTTR
jgi:hypothetical protein